MFSSGGKKEHNYLNFQLFIMYQHSFDSSQVRFENITINSFYKQTEPKQQFKFPFKKLQNSTYAESKYNTENSFTTNAGSKKNNNEYSPSQKCEPSTHLHRFPLLHNNKSRGIVFGTFNRLRLYLLGNRELTFTSSKKIN